MNAYLKKILSLASFLVAATLTGGVVAPMAVAADVASRDASVLMTVNDGELGTTPFTFSFSAGWVHEGGYPDRFEGGDEHWTTTAQFGTSYPSFTFRFVGSQVSLYGHKVPAGAMADVSVDGAVVGRIDYYNDARIERTLLWESDRLDYGEHTVVVQLVAEQNPAAGGTHEASVDYAVVRTSESRPVTSVEASVDTLLLEPGMSYTLGYTLLPTYATEIPTITFASADPSVLIVDEKGTITAVAPGKTTVTLAPDTGDYRDTVTVTVREPVGGDLVVLAGSTGEHVRQDGYLDRLASLKLDATTLSMTAWRSDIATAKIDLLTKGKPAVGVRAEVGTLTNAHGDTLKATATISPVRDTLAHDSGHLIPDVIGGGETLDLPAGSVGALWLRLETPDDALPGIYTAPITVRDEAGNETALTLSVEVIGLKRPQNTVALELWQYPYSANRYYSGKTTVEYFGEGLDGIWHTHLDPAYTDALRSQIELYASAGGNTVTVTITEDPWNSQTPDPYPSMIKWTRGSDGRFRFDYTDFDYWVSLNESCGVTGGIMSFSIADWANRVTYYDERTGTVKSEQLTPGSARWKQVWSEFLTDYMAHTTEKGWFERVYLSMDERPAEVVEAVLDVVESVRNEKGECFKTSLAVFTFETEHLYDRVTDLSLAIYMDASKLKDITAHRRTAGLTTTLYTCGAQFSALENPPYESLYGMWYCEKMGADGFLRWALDAFNDDPLRASTHRLFAAGDIYLIYPDEKDAENPTARTSPRFEKLAEGCRDISKLRYLKGMSDAHAAEVESILKNIGRGAHLAREVERAQNAMNRLARRAALDMLLAEAKTAEVANPEALAEAIADAEKLLGESDPANDALGEAAYLLEKLLGEPLPEETETESESASETVTETETETVTETETDTERGSDTETESEAVQDPDSGTEIDSVTQSTDITETDEAEADGCASSVAGAAAVLGVASAAVAVTLHRKSEHEES